MMKRKVDEHLYNRNEHKKVRTDDPEPSRVLHLRNLPSEATLSEISNIAIPFGMITYLVLTRKSAQALIEMKSIDTAKEMFDYYQQWAPYLRNKRCFVQYSIHNSLQTPGSSMHPEAETAVIAANQLCASMSNEPFEKVVRIIIDDWNNERISSLHLFKIFQHFGTIEKVVSYINKGIYQGFIQFTDPLSAKVAKTLTNGSCIFPRSCTMQVTLSSRKTLDISREDDMVRDFVKHPVTSYELKQLHYNAEEESTSKYNETLRISHDPIGTLAALQPFLSQAVNYPEDALPLLRSLAPAIRELLGGDQDCVDMNQNFERNNGKSRSNFGEKTSSLLIVSNLNEAKVNPDALFKLFGCYGDVTRVKIMYNRKNTALIQFVSDEHAQRALQFLNGINLFGKPIHANFSKHDRISQRAPASNDDNEPGSDALHKDYAGHKLHRYKKATSRNHVNVYEPSRVLHLAGLVEEVSVEDVEAVFEDHNFSVKKIKMLTPKNTKMALVEMESVEVAVEALIVLHDFDLCGSHLRVSFSKSLLN